MASLGPVLAEGGGAFVHRAHRADGRERIVVKRARPGNEALLELERNVCERVDHPNLVRYLGGARTEDDELALAFELLEPDPLLFLNGAARRPKAFDPGTPYYPLPPGRALELAYDVLLAIEYLHARGLVHADVKLANVLVRTPPFVEGADSLGPLPAVAQGWFSGVLIDLGSVRTLEELAGIARDERDDLHAPEITPLYAPPEALEGVRAFGPAMDVYATGVLVYGLVTGRVPFDHLVPAEKLRNLDVLLDLKKREAKGEVRPFVEEALDAIPLQDVQFEGSAATAWPHFRSGIAHFLERSLDADPARRIAANDARRAFEERLRIKRNAVAGERPWVQRLFTMRPRSNRLVGDVARDGLRIAEGEDGAVSADEGVAPRPAPGQPAARTRVVPLWEVLRDVRAGHPLGIAPPILATHASLGPRDLVDCRIVSLGARDGRVRLGDDGVPLDAGRVTIGRTPDNDVHLSVSTVSKRHALLERDADGWLLVDAGSVNGTALDGAPLAKGERRRLPDSDALIGIGPDVVLSLLDGPDLARFLERAALAWKTAYGDADAPPRTDTGRVRTERLHESNEVLAPPRPPREDRTQRVPRGADALPLPPPRRVTPPPSALDKELEPVLAAHSGKGTFHVYLEDARVETAEETAEALEILRDNGGDVLRVELHDRDTRERTLLYDRARAKRPS